MNTIDDLRRNLRFKYQSFIFWHNIHDFCPWWDYSADRLHCQPDNQSGNWRTDQRPVQLNTRSTQLFCYRLKFPFNIRQFCFNIALKFVLVIFAEDARKLLTEAFNSAARRSSSSNLLRGE